MLPTPQHRIVETDTHTVKYIYRGR